MFQLTMESGDDLELTLEEFQKWYHNKEPKTANSKVSYTIFIIEYVFLLSLPFSLSYLLRRLYCDN